MLFWLACAGPAPAPSPETEDTDSVPATVDLDDERCASLYDQDALPRFELTLADAEIAGLDQDYATGVKPYHPATLTYDGDTVPVGVRLKGNPSFSWFGGKWQFVVSFVEYDPEARFHGLRHLALDASWYEPTLLRDRLSWAVMRQIDGLPSTCVNNAELYVNGEYYGLYANIEYYDHEWLEHNFEGSEGGVLYKYGTEPKTNEVGSDERKIAEILASSDPDALAAAGDVDEWRLAWAAEAVLGDDDGYWCCAHNFYVYDHPERGALFVPWDFDDSLEIMPYDADPLTGYEAGRRWGLFRQPPYLALTGTDEGREAWVDAVEAASLALDPDVVLPALDAWSAQIDASFLADPRRTVGTEQRVQAMARLKAWIPARRAFLDSWVACARGEATDGDGDGAGVCEDPNDADPTVHPAGTETCDGVDEDADGVVDDDPACDDCRREDLGDRHFLLCRGLRSRDDSEAMCEARGGSLATPRDGPETTLVYFDTWPVIEKWWLGPTDRAAEDSWIDLDGTVPGYAAWLGGEPDGGAAENCAAWDTVRVGWASEDCAAVHPSICVVP